MARLQTLLVRFLDWLLWRLQVWRARLTHLPTVAESDAEANRRYNRRLVDRYARWGRR